MPTNRLVIEKNEALEVKVYDADGAAHDITTAFRSIAGTTAPGSVTNTIVAQDGDTDIFLDFQATEKAMEFGLAASVVKQLVALGDG